MRITSTIGRRLAATLAAGALAAGLGIVAAAPAQAVSLGTLTITPATGDTAPSSILNATLSADCPGGSTSINGFMAGPGISEVINGKTESVIQSNRAVATSFTFGLNFRDVFVANSVASPSGTYTVRIACIGANFFSEVGEFSQQVNFTPTGGAQNATYATVSNATATSTALAVGTPDPVAFGTATSLTATVSPSNAPGSVQFKRGATSIGSPIAVVGGIATLDSTVLPAGTQNLTAVFTPSDASFATSISTPRAYVVAGPATISGVARVGSILSCNSAPTPGATVAYSWFFGTKLSATTTKTLKVPATWKGLQAKCVVKTTKNAVTITQTSPLTAKIAAGPAPVATKKPYITGILRVAKTLTCNKGTWTLSPSSYKYQWLRSGKALTGKTFSTYRTTSLDKGKLISCKVTAVKSGYLNGTATSAAKKIL